ncbi:glycosyltransferase family 2 protein [Dyella sp. Tek66A03]|uniref:glycosyltransferase family 2 protein n=1 Tax=Dyella sp. Tek66A03 TaxID=3458298 RepID=UPI00403E78D4
MTPDLVSVIMPAYNAQRTLRASVLSVREQTYPSLELIIVDDGSRDGTTGLICELARADHRLRVLYQPSNNGVAAARNAGIDAAQGSYIAFLDSDDRWHPHKLDLQITHMRRTGALVSYTAYDRVAEDGHVLSRVRPPAMVTHDDMLRSNHIGNLTGIYHRSLGEARFLAVGHEDYVFWLDLVRRAGGASCVPYADALAWYLVHGGSLSSDKLRAARWQWHIYRDIERLGWAAASHYMCHYAWQAMRKRH